MQQNADRLYNNKKNLTVSFSKNYDNSIDNITKIDIINKKSSQTTKWKSRSYIHSFIGAFF